jgi:translation initiation factor IF-2
LNSKDAIAAESAYGQIKVMEDFLGRHMDKAEPSTPVLITGFNTVPPVGEEWQVMASLDEARAKAEIKRESEKRKREQVEFLDIKEDQKVLNIVLKADFSGSLEAIREALKSIPQNEIIMRVIKGEVGDINENDVKLAHSAKAKIFGFRVKSTEVADKLAQRDNVKITLWQIIYELIQTIRHNASILLSPEIIKEKQGRLRILATFKQDGKKQIIGGRVASGKIKRGALADIFRSEEFIGNGRISQLQVNKQSVAEALKDKECGLLFESDVTVEKSDILEVYEEQRRKREL